MKYDIDNALIPFLFFEAGWKCPETEEDPDADSETFIHPDMPGVCIRIAEIDGKGGLAELLRQVYEQATELKADTDAERQEQHRESEMETIRSHYPPDCGSEREAAKTLFLAVYECGWETLPTAILVRMAELQLAEHDRYFNASLANRW